MCLWIRMPKVEKDCHAFTISSEREKRREMDRANQPGQGPQHGKSLPFPGKGGPHHHGNPHFNKNANPFFQKQTQMPNSLNQNMGINQQQHHKGHGDGNQQHLSRTHHQPHQSHPKPNQPGKPDLQQKTGAIEEHKEDNGRTRNGSIDNKDAAGKKAGQQDLSGLEKITKRQCTDEAKTGSTVDVGVNGK